MLEYDDMDARTLDCALELVRRHTGVSMSPAKQSMLQGRLRPRMRALRLASYEHYLRRLREDDSERQPFIDAVTTHHTAFFRTPRVWEYLEQVFLPAWVAQHPGRALQVWSAAASTGEEACSLAICCEELRRRHPGFDYRISATDIATGVLERARDGVYAGAPVAAFRAARPDLFARHNALDAPDRFALAPSVRARIAWAAHDLFQPSPSIDTFDLVLLRNVLIYFKPDDIMAVVRNVAPALRTKGIMVIGEAESLTSLDLPFQFVQPQIYRRTA